MHKEKDEMNHEYMDPREYMRMRAGGWDFDPMYPYMHRMKMFPKFGPRHFIGRNFLGYNRAIIENIESKEEAIDLLEIQIKRLEKYKKRMLRRIDRMGRMEKEIETAINDIGQMQEFSNKEMQKILKKRYLELQKKILDEEN
ncbi:MAG: hypothetical protein JXA54_17250 [Candidatus Heimdallarchaeota archaeon]|nr:hypothetical protein [Candidatus Heimdallarchaeota archaeon]